MSKLLMTIAVTIFVAGMSMSAFAQTLADRHLACLKDLRLTYAKSRRTAMARPLGGWEALRPSEKADIGGKALEDAQRLISVSGADRSYTVCLTALNNVRTECRADKTC